MTAPDPAWVEAGAQAIDGEEATATSGYYGASYRVDSDHAAELAHAVLTAALPLIREQIAREIEAEKDALSAKINEAQFWTSPMTMEQIEQIDSWASERVGLNRAVRIARGGNR